VRHTSQKRSITIPRFLGALFILITGSLLGTGCQTIDRTREAAGVPAGVVVFTFDDGPEGDTTGRLLDTLQRHGIQAGFALLGENVDRYPEITRRIQAEGHVIINHGYRDTWAVFMTPEEFLANLDQGEAALEAALGRRPEKFYRPQGGFYTKKEEAIWRARGYLLAPGTIRVYDAVLDAGDAEEVTARVLIAVKERGGGIVLLHDGRDGVARRAARREDPAFDRSWIPDVVERIIRSLEENGFILTGFDVAELLRRAAGAGAL